MEAVPDLPPPLGDVAPAPPPASSSGRAPARAGAAVRPFVVEPDGDEALMIAFGTGDAEAFARLYERHERSTWRFIRHRLGRSHESAVEDVMQETWISVARAAARYVPSARFTTWLYSVARSRTIDYLRARGDVMTWVDEARAAEEEEGEDWLERVAADDSAGPVARIESRQQSEAFLEALASLPLPQREAFVLQAESGLSLEEIAEATGVGVETAKTRLRYARARLRILLAGWRTT